ncbi:Cytidine deaminase [Pseudoalteromonas luteoviolacea B = ATCC 29581]|nr:Cytidine deaminase [Pseudoalteromonas luteoviolacea B = ATCC 29581]
MLSQDMLIALYERIKASRGILGYAQVSILCDELELDVEALMIELLPVAAKFALPPISKFYVGAIALERTSANSGNLYFGANLEFSDQALGLVVHAEQSAINNAWLNGAKQIDLIAITDAPCGHCRQFMNEMHNADALSINLPHKRTSLRRLLPEDFGPKDLDNHESLFQSTKQALSFSMTISDALCETVCRSYAPYTGNYCAVELETNKGRFVGGYIENAAYNPSLSPLQSALSQIQMSGYKLEEISITNITLVEQEGKKNQLGVVKAVISSLGYEIAIKEVTAYGL